MVSLLTATDRWRPSDGPALRRLDLDPGTGRFFGYSVEQAAALPDSHYDGTTAWPGRKMTGRVDHGVAAPGARTALPADPPREDHRVAGRHRRPHARLIGGRQAGTSKLARLVRGRP
jgi:hypothetical protein